MLARTGLMPPTWASSGLPSWPRIPMSMLRGRSGRADQRGVLALEDRGIAGDAAFDRLFEDDVGLVEARLGTAGGVVVDLDCHGRALRHRSAGSREPGQRARRASAPSWWSSSVRPWPPRRGGWGRRNRRSAPPRRVRRWPRLPTRTVGAPVSESRRMCPCLRADGRGATPKSGVMHAWLQVRAVCAPPARGRARSVLLRPTGCPRRCPPSRRLRCRCRTSCRPSCHRRWRGRGRSGRRRSPWPGGRLR